MADVDLVESVEETRAIDVEAFGERVSEEAEVIKAELAEGTFNNPQGSIGLEYEFYAVAEPEVADGRSPASEGGRLMRVPRRLLTMIGFEEELGLHNAEMSTSPQPLNRYGLASQASEVKARLSAALKVTQTEGMRLVSDGIWTIPPEGETAQGYLTDAIVQDGIAIASNMSDAVRYHTFANAHAANPGMVLDAPHVSLEAETVMPESLITSIQPHCQIPTARDLPDYFQYALRIAPPLLALGVNSPFFPPELYDDETTIEDVLADGHHEHRISVFESVMNDPDEERGKVRFPRDLDSAEEAIDRIVADDLIVPTEIESRSRFDDEFAHFRHKHGSYWRWVRPVFDGPSRSAANARIEFRVLSGQPTVRDVIAFQAAFAGLLIALRRVDHPVADLDRETVRDDFYRAARDGLDAEIHWITEDGEETTTNAELYGDLLAQAETGLSAAGVPETEIREYLQPLRSRVVDGRTPASWKRERARETAEDGTDLGEAIEHAQREYLERQRTTLLEGSFADWPEG